MPTPAHPHRVRLHGGRNTHAARNLNSGDRETACDYFLADGSRNHWLPADELRTAAEKLRAHATAAGASPWTADHYPEGTIVRPSDSHVSLFNLAAEGNRAAGTPCVTPPIGAYIALMDPTVGRALAQWLDQTAAHLTASTHPSWQDTVAALPLAVARALNGDPR